MVDGSICDDSAKERESLNHSPHNPVIYFENFILIFSLFFSPLSEKLDKNCQTRKKYNFCKLIFFLGFHATCSQSEDGDGEPSIKISGNT